MPRKNRSRSRNKNPRSEAKRAKRNVSCPCSSRILISNAKRRDAGDDPDKSEKDEECDKTDEQQFDECRLESFNLISSGRYHALSDVHEPVRKFEDWSTKKQKNTNKLKIDQSKRPVANLKETDETVARLITVHTKCHSKSGISSEFSQTQRRSENERTNQHNDEVAQASLCDRNVSFPLEESHMFVICCENCLIRSDVFGEYTVRSIVHKCSRSILAVKRKAAGNWLKMRKLRQRSKTARCWNEQCGDFETCRYAHSDEEKKLWDLEVRGTFSIANFIAAHQCDDVAALKLTDSRDRPQKLETGRIESQKPTQQRPAPDNQSKPDIIQVCERQRPRQQQPAPDNQSKADIIQVCERQRPRQQQPAPDNHSKPDIIQVCGTCWKNGQMNGQSSSSPSHCSANHLRHDWQSLSIYIVMPHKKIIQQPPNINGDFKLCKHIEDGKKCSYPKCHFAHSEVERRVWEWMKSHGINHLSAIARDVRSSQATIEEPKRGNSHDVLDSLDFTQPIRMEMYYCKFCNKTCNSEAQLRSHCSSKTHITNVNSDNERMWKYRHPPLFIHRDKYKLCPGLSKQNCPYIKAHQESNMCVYAHSVEELEEWNRRLKYRREKRKQAKREHLYSYMDELRKEFESAESERSVLTEDLEGIQIECQDGLDQLKQDKNDIVTWSFRINSKKEKLKIAALLLEKDRNFFRFIIDHQHDSSLCQLLDGASVLQSDNSYYIRVQFEACMFGSFSQSVVFDFGRRPVVVRKLHVDICHRHELEKIRKVRERLDFVRWTEDNSEIIRFPHDLEIDEEKLVDKYKAPSSVDAIVNQEILCSEPNRDNYIRVLHGLLELEELERTQLISRFSQTVNLHVEKQIYENNVFLNAPQGHMFAWFELPELLNKDTASGRLIIMSVATVLLREVKTSQSVYEGVILSREKFDFDGRTQDKLYICLSERCVSDWRMKRGEQREVDIQFEINRLAFCRYHRALDEQHPVHVLYPDVKNKKTFVGGDNKISDRDNYLNEQQLHVLESIATSKKRGNLPIVICSPFGTGKTETLALAAKILARRHPENTRILICTYSNRAADIYIEKYFHRFVEEDGLPLHVLRLHQNDRRLNTIPDTVRNYCSFSADRRSVVMPTTEQIRMKHIVVSTMTVSLCLVEMYDIKGHFSHIFIDEAAQALQCEVMMPLALATHDTCVVLAGDHKQMRQEVFSPEARQQNLNRSVIEQLYDYYGRYGREELCHLLNYNYRATEEILHFISSVFYGNPECLISRYSWKDKPPGMPSMNFFIAQGKEMYDSERTSWYNEAEVDEVVVRVRELYEMRPWNDCKETDIGVVAAEDAQVRRIRVALRRNGLGQIKVLEPMAVQGDEFHAVFISTVRTLECPLESTGSLDLGFLTNRNLLNTVITRTKNYIGVIGRPETLCTTGECSRIWIKYIEHCQKTGSINAGFDLQTILASDLSASDRFYNNEITLQENTGNDENELETDEILIQLALEGKKRSKDKPGQGHITFGERDDVAYAVYKTVNSQRKSKRKLLGADDCDREYQSGGSDSEVDDMEESGVNQADYSPDRLRNLVNKFPQRYKRCILQCKRLSKIHAHVVDANDDVKEIVIGTRQRCNRALDNDEVCVEVKQFDEEDKIFTSDRSRVVLPHGEVIGIFKRAMSLDYRKIVCTVDELNRGVLIPIDISLPRMKYLTNSDRLSKQAKQTVPVFSFTKSKDVVFDRFEKTVEDNGDKKLFVARFLKWERHFLNPLCVIITSMPMGTNMEKGLNILDIKHWIPRPFPSDIVNAEREFQAYLRTTDEGRLDRRHLHAFTIDPDESDDLDDALSIQQIDSDHFLIGVHISDVSYFVRSNTSLDDQAKARGTTYYPAASNPIHMLPAYLSTDLCSLQPGRDRKTLSLFIQINSQAELLSRDIARCTIKSRTRLTYKEAEMILDGHESGKDVTAVVAQSIRTLHRITSIWRKRRLGNASYFHNLDKDSEDSPKAHHLVEEMMIEANKSVAQILLRKYPDCVPLRAQPPPQQDELDLWIKAFSNIASNTFVLRQPFHLGHEVCRCQANCARMLEHDENVLAINVPVWKDTVASWFGKANDKSRFNLANPHILPEATVALAELFKIREEARYICSGEYRPDLQGHDTVQTSAYAHFTSPIRRYIDIVVHRLLIAQMRKEPCPYSREEISQLCHQCTAASQRAKAYENDTKVLEHAVHLYQSSKTLHAVIDSFCSNDLQLKYIGSKAFASFERRLKASHLQLFRQPTLTEQEVVLSWALHIYDVNHEMQHNEALAHRHLLNPHRFVSFIREAVWKDLLKALRSQKTDEIRRACESVQHEVSKCQSDKYLTDISSEVRVQNAGSQLCHFSLELGRASVLKIQMSARIHRGLLRPCIQLLSLTPTLDVCIEHQSDPVPYFVDMTKCGLIRKRYDTLKDYVAGWSQLIAIEAVRASLRDGNSIIIHNVNITWTKEYCHWFGTFQLEEEFCEARSIQFETRNIDDEDGDADDAEESFLNYICVRYSNLSGEKRESASLDHCYSADGKAPWVGHCMATEASRNKQTKIVSIIMKLMQNKESILNTVILGKQPATIELIPRFYPLRREEQILSSIDDSVKMKLFKAVILNKKIPNMSEAHLKNMTEIITKRVPGLPKPNRPQQEAVNQALNRSFTLIQGPPGTGKTVTGVRLAYLLAQYNKTRPSQGDIRPQLLICGPSNDSVDVFTAQLSKIGHECPLMIRVYGSTIEQQDFPLPSTIDRKPSHYVRNTKLNKYALHHVIRDPRKCHMAKDIRKFDEEIKELIDNQRLLGVQEKKKYQKLIADAKCDVIERHEIILCTCHVSGSDIIRKATNVKQLIIDESGMCTEPQSIVPMVSARPEQIILIGDHRQLQPIITEDRAKRLGLGLSLFERYAKEAYMLDVQYRMHQAIAAFPSEQFYDSRLQCGLEIQKRPSRLSDFWPGGRHQPIVFIHTVGKEECVTVSTPDGNENSRSNMEEVKQVVGIAFHLIQNKRVRPNEILIMSQYRAQCTKIKEELDKRYLSIEVSTVVAAQGQEKEFVILSTVRSMSKPQIEKQPSESWSKKHLGFINDKHQINVAITRAKEGVIIIGNKNLLQSNSVWRNLLEHYGRKHAVADAQSFLKVTRKMWTDETQ